MNIKKIFCVLIVIMSFISVSYAQSLWEKDGDFYFLSKENGNHFSAVGPGENKFNSKYLKYDGIDFLVRAPQKRQDYGRLNLEGNNIFFVPISSGATVDELHLLAGGSYSNSYSHDSILKFYGDKYFYGSITVIFAYQDGAYKALSAPVFWDWFHLGRHEWSKDGVKVKSLGDNPMRKDCNFYHIIFSNPYPTQPLRGILIEDSWLSDVPFSDIFALTVKSNGTFDASSKQNEYFK